MKMFTKFAGGVLFVVTLTTLAASKLGRVPIDSIQGAIIVATLLISGAILAREQ